MNLIILGYPGSGKGTQSKALAQRYGIVHISTGDILRDAIAAKGALGEQAASYVNAGQLVPDQMIFEILRLRLDGILCERPGGAPGFLLDGFPRTLPQAQDLDRYLKQQGRAIDLVLFLDLTEKEVVRRLTSRRMCSACGTPYNLVFRPPKKDGVCDACSKALVQREDDMPGTVQRRLVVYKDLTEPLAAYYKSNELFFRVNASQKPEQVTETIAGEIGTRLLKKA
ncbi:MAG: adenylate kinase [Elusimicrobia bacterium RIFCSPLOWO2_12_FULL_59_9]|nr:MAG: adenylate kinase [Elusimicrobia bacterium RIFCSPLOWO2_12_FULL_59_9]